MAVFMHVWRVGYATANCQVAPHGDWDFEWRALTWLPFFSSEENLLLTAVVEFGHAFNLQHLTASWLVSIAIGNLLRQQVQTVKRPVTRQTVLC
eukprot:1697215-Amphidinium_carterae.1